jgi:hypothetical protein
VMIFYDCADANPEAINFFSDRHIWACTTHSVCDVRCHAVTRIVCLEEGC